MNVCGYRMPGGVVLFTYSCETKLVFTLHGPMGVQLVKHCNLIGTDITYDDSLFTA